MLLAQQAANRSNVGTSRPLLSSGRVWLLIAFGALFCAPPVLIALWFYAVIVVGCFTSGVPAAGVFGIAVPLIGLGAVLWAIGRRADSRRSV